MNTPSRFSSVAPWGLVFSLLTSACFKPPVGGAEESTDASTTASDPSTTGESETATSLAEESTTGPDGSTGVVDGSTSGSSTTDEPPMCTDECDPMDTDECTEDGSASQSCVLGDDGCHDRLETPCGDAVCMPGLGCVALAASCAEILTADPAATDGVYLIDPDGLGGLAPFDVQCDMTTDGGGWTLIAFNDETTTFVEFDRPWQEYKDGFGDLAGGQLGWLGNDRMHALTAGGVQLHVRHDDPLTNVYADFSVGDEASSYQLSVSTTPDSVDGGFFEGDHDGRPFSTYDQDNDTHPDNCADTRRAGWWYSACFAVSIASASEEDGQVYWRLPPNTGAPAWVEWIGMWIR